MTPGARIFPLIAIRDTHGVVLPHTIHAVALLWSNPTGEWNRGTGSSYDANALAAVMRATLD
jgi:hypothetical protein